VIVESAATGAAEHLEIGGRDFARKPPAVKLVAVTRTERREKLMPR